LSIPVYTEIMWGMSSSGRSYQPVYFIVWFQTYLFLSNSNVNN